MFIIEDCERLGFSREGLMRIGQSYREGVAAGEIPGAVLLISRHGELVFRDVVGFRDAAAEAPMAIDTRFHLASMTKPVTSVAAMLLVEAGQLDLEAPVSRYIPELGGLKVGREIAEPTGGALRLVLEDAARAPTILDLFRHTAGFTYGQFGDSLVQRAYRAANVFDLGQSNADMVAKLAALPLAYQPGSTFEYGMSTDVLGRVIEVISGQTLDVFVHERILAPLGMRDTGFQIGDPATLAIPRDQMTMVHAPVFNWAAGGHGLFGTASDYLRFTEMLVEGGTLDGVRLLSRESVATMMRDHLPPGIAFGPYPIGVVAPTRENGNGFGLGFCVRVSEDGPMPGNIGDFNWPGASGAAFWGDPKLGLSVVALTAAYDVREAYRIRARQLVYAALAG